MRQPRGYIDRMAELSRQPDAPTINLPPLDGPIDDEDILRRIAPIDSVDPYTDFMRKAETFVLGLRLNRGVAEQDYQRRFGVLPTEFFREAIKTSVSDGLLERDADILRLTARGRLLSNEVFVRIMAKS